MRAAYAGLILLLAAFGAAAQAPLQDRVGREQAIHSGQLRAGAAYSDMQQARHEAKFAEQNFLAAQDAQRAAQKHAEDTNRQLDSARNTLDGARAREVQARKAYDNALLEVERAVRGTGANR